MTIKKLCMVGLLSICLFGALSIQAQDNPLGQTFQINTHLDSYVGKPTWILIVTDVETGQVLPYMFNITSNDNFWIQFTFAHAYRISSSELQFGPPDKVIHNFCHLQDGILDRESLVINLSGDLTPNRKTADCQVLRYKEYSFPIVEAEAPSATVENNNPIAPFLANIPTSIPNLATALAKPTFQSK